MPVSASEIEKAESRAKAKAPRQYTEEYRLEAVEYCRKAREADPKKSIRECAAELGINDKTLNDWVIKYGRTEPCQYNGQGSHGEGARGRGRHAVAPGRGKELSDAEGLQEALGAPACFCHPRHPWERGTDENADGLLGGWFPKGGSPDDVAAARCRRHAIRSAGDRASVSIGSAPGRSATTSRCTCSEDSPCILRVKLTKIALEGTVVIDFEHYALTPPGSKRVAMGRTRLSEMTEILLDRALGNLETRSYIFLPERQSCFLEHM